MTVHKEAVSVTEMAKMVGLRRTRFYQLIASGVFPPPEHDATTRRPFYSRELQQKCLDVCHCNVGVNGQRVIFYAKRTKARSKPKRATTNNSQFDDLAKSLRSLGVADATPEKVKAIMMQLYPVGVKDVGGEMLRRVFLAFHGKCSE
jgi:hypothetical protein